MNPSHPSPFPGLSIVQVILIILGVVCLGFLIACAVLRLATKWVAGFEPTWGRTCGAFICAIILAAIADTVVSNALGGKLGQVDPRLAVWAFPIALLSQILTYKTILPRKEEDDEEVSYLQAGLIAILQQVLNIAVLVVLVIVLLVSGLTGTAQLKKLQFHFDPRNAPLSTQSPQPFSPLSMIPPGFATVADAQKEAVRRYPMLGVKGSPMNKAYVERYGLYQKTKPDFFLLPSWPITLANEVAKDPSVR